MTGGGISTVSIYPLRVIYKEAVMDMTIHLSDREVNFLREVINEHKHISPKEFTLEDAIHECIRDAMFDESEKNAEEEFE